MTDGVYIVRRGKTYRVTANCKCTARSCSLYDAAKCNADSDDLPCMKLYDIADRSDVGVGACNFMEVRT